MPRQTVDKRKLLIEAALNGFHKNGYAKTSIADISRESKVPLGNVSYYFKTKAELAHAVVEEWRNRLSSYLPETDDAWLALQSFVKASKSLSNMYATLGCPLAGLARDLRQEEEPLRSLATDIHEIQLNWVESQFIKLGFERSMAKRHSNFLIAHLHGAIHLAFTQNDESFLDDEVVNICTWLEELRSQKSLKKSKLKGQRG